MADLTLREKMREIIFGTEPGPGRTFDIVLIAVIISSVTALFLDSVASIHARWGDWLYAAELGFTLLFTVEYLARVYCSADRRQYMFSFYGLVDLLATLP
ncbi:MAG: ion transporter, partial [Spongiibacter sp.]